MKIKDKKYGIEQDARITKYLKGQMSSDEEQVFSAGLKQDSELRAKAVVIARMIKAMKEVGAEKDKEIMAAFKRINDSREVRQKIMAVVNGEKLSATARILFLPRKTFVSISVAASIILCVWGGWRMYDNYQMNALGEEYLAYFPMPKYTRGENDSATAQIAKLYKDIEDNEDISVTIKQLEKIWILSTQDEYNEYTEYAPHIGWLLANAYIRNNDKDKAIQTLNAIIQNVDNNSAIANKAIELKKKIENRKIF